MTVAELIEKLKQYPPDYLVCCASDEEGNSFNILSDYISDEAEWDEEEQTVLFEDEDSEIEPNAIVLWP